MIRGIPATESHNLHPEQWVNIYELGIAGDAEFYDCCQVSDLDLDDPSEYRLELIDEAGKLMPVGEALK
ncbi:hypothetical protein [Microcoleus sp. Pol12A5]|uniref:hypothetical protein n=1 Tax=Microcoleus sp. Pol12A5 TaxID=3055392 RepID=UPI002FD4D74F